MSPRGDHSDFSGFVRRILRAYSRRCACSDPADLTELLALQGEVDVAIDAAVAGLRSSGFTWAEIAEAADTSRQAAHKRWSVNPRMTADRGTGASAGGVTNDPPSAPTARTA